MTDKPNMLRRAKAAIIRDCTVPDLTWLEACIFSIGMGGIVARDWWTAATIMGVFIVIKATRGVKQEKRHE